MPHAYTNGIATFYEDSGDGQAVVLIHGYSVDSRLWQHQTPALVKAGFRVVSYDVRGHGRSMVPPVGYTWENYSQDLAELLDRLNLESAVTQPLGEPAAHVVGLSMGGGIALQFALDHPERVLSLTLVDSVLPGYQYGEEMSRPLEEMRAAVARDGLRAVFDGPWLDSPLFDGVRRRPAAFELVRQMVHGYQAPDYQSDQARPVGYQPPDIAARLGDIQARTLVIVGEDDLADFRLIAEMLAGNIAEARLDVMERCGHIPPLEEPERLNEVLVEFLRC